MRVYPLAKMDGVMWVLTVVVFAVPVFFFYTGDPRLTPFAFGMLALCGVVWAYGRPRLFEVSRDALVIVWPIRTRHIERADITHAAVVTRDQFHERYGRSVRLGVGGLFGQFGWAWTSKGLVSTYISTLGPFVLVEIEDSRPLLITPEDPEAFVGELTSPGSAASP